MRRKIFGRSSSSSAPEEEATEGKEAAATDQTVDAAHASTHGTADPKHESEPAEREKLKAARDAAIAERDAAIAERNAAVAESDSAASERDIALAERDSAASERDEALSELESAIAERDDARAQRDAAEDQREAARIDCEIATAELHAAIVEGNSLRSKLVASGGFTEPRSNLDAGDLVHAANVEAQAIRAEAQCAAERIIELAQERASTVHRNAEAEFRERIRRIADEPADAAVADTQDIAPIDLSAELADLGTAELTDVDAPEITHVVTARHDRPAPPPPPTPGTAKSFESLWQAASSVDDGDLERFFSEELERTERRALFES